jgi:CHAT domain-containing protein
MKQTQLNRLLLLLFYAAFFIVLGQPVGNDPKVVADSLVFIRKRERDSILAENYHQKGVGFYNDGCPQAAFNQFDIALSIRQLVFDSLHKDIVRSYLMLGLTQDNLNHYSKSIIFYQKATNILEKRQNQKDSTLWSTVYNSYGSTLNSLGEYQQAQNLLGKGRMFISTDPANYASFYDILATSLNGLGKPQQAINYYLKAVEYNLLAGEINNLARDYINIGYINRIRNKPDSALLATWTALYYFNKQKEKTPETYIEFANARNELAHSYFALNDFKNAKKHYTIAQQLLQKHGSKNHPRLSETLIGLGHIAKKEGNKMLALQYFKQAEAVVIPEFKNVSLLATPSVKEPISHPLKAIDALSATAKFLQELAQDTKATPQYLVAANRHYALLDSLIFDLCNSYSEDNSKIKLIEKFVPIYESAASLALQNRDTTGFLHYIDRPKAFVLRSLMTDRHIKKLSDMPSEALTFERNLEIDRAYWHKKAIEDKQDATAQDSFFAAQRRLEKWTESLPQKYPRYAELKKRQKHAPLSINDLKSRLKDSMALIEYFVGNDSIYTFVVSKSKTLIQSQVMPVGFKDSFNLFRHTFTSDSSGNQLQGNFLRLSALFYTWLVKDPLSKINEKKDINRLRIVPDGILGYLPFNLLLTDSAVSWQANESYKPPFLINDFAISYDYSRELMFASTFYRALPNKLSNHRLGGFGIEYDDLTLSWMRIAGKKLEKLDNSPREVVEVKAQVGGDVFTDRNKNPLLKDFFIKAKDKYSILHLSMHGAINDDDPLSSALIFSKKTASDDNLLTAAEIYALDFNQNDLTVLSACQTASGQLNRGEGIMSLARAFVMGGSRSVVATLWSVGNEEMYQLMPIFYGNLKKGMDKDIALQAAQKTYAQTHITEPNKWAAPIIIGNLDMIPFDNSPNYGLWLVIGLIALIVLGLIFYRQKKGKQQLNSRSPLS